MTFEERIFNKNIKRYRHTVERTLGNLKKWHILRNRFRGKNLDHHHYIFETCCIFTEILNKF